MSPILVDSNVLIDVMLPDPRWVEWSEEQLTLAFYEGEAAINPIIYAELSRDYHTEAELDRALSSQLTRLPLPYGAGFPAGRAHRAYREQGGAKTSPLPDFFIGGHAEVAGMKILTRDVKRYRTYFPKVELVAPPKDLLQDTSSS